MGETLPGGFPRDCGGDSLFNIPGLVSRNIVYYASRLRTAGYSHLAELPHCSALNL